MASFLTTDPGHSTLQHDSSRNPGQRPFVVVLPGPQGLAGAPTSFILSWQKSSTSKCALQASLLSSTIWEDANLGHLDRNRSECGDSWWTVLQKDLKTRPEGCHTAEPSRQTSPQRRRGSTVQESSEGGAERTSLSLDTQLALRTRPTKFMGSSLAASLTTRAPSCQQLLALECSGYPGQSEDAGCTRL
ncbi:hypothetical protein CapIbe_014405 [Capra ibex]